MIKLNRKDYYISKKNMSEIPNPVVEGQWNPPATAEDVANAAMQSDVAQEIRDAWDTSAVADSQEADALADSLVGDVTAWDEDVSSGYTPETDEPETGATEVADSETDLPDTTEESDPQTDDESDQSAPTEPEESAAEKTERLAEEAKAAMSEKRNALTAKLESIKWLAPIAGIVTLLPDSWVDKISKWWGMAMDMFEGKKMEKITDTITEALQEIDLPFDLSKTDMQGLSDLSKYITDEIDWVNLEEKSTWIALLEWKWESDLLEKLKPISEPIQQFFRQNNPSKSDFLALVSDPKKMIKESQGE